MKEQDLATDENIMCLEKENVEGEERKRGEGRRGEGEGNRGENLSPGLLPEHRM